jgi:hypothetical protein
MKISSKLSCWLIYFIISFLLIFPGCSSSPTSETNDPIIQSFYAEPSSISSGENSTLHWQVSDATSVSIDQGIGVVATISGSTAVSPTVTTTYTLTAINASGTVTATTTVMVDEQEEDQEEVDGYGIIEIGSTPSGATVYLDGLDIGEVTPAILLYIEVGIHAIKLEKYHYKTMEDTNISVTAGDTTTINWTLTYASTGTLTLKPGSEGKDADVYELLEVYNYGNEDGLRVGCEDYYDYRTYLQFELTPIPEDAIVIDASLSLYHDDFDGSGYFSIGLYRVSSYWEEATITWNNQPTSASVAEAYADVFYTTFTSIGTWRTWQIDDLVEGWWDGSINNYGMVLKREEACPGDRSAVFLSSDSIDSSKRPKLEVDYYIP